MRLDDTVDLRPKDVPRPARVARTLLINSLVSGARVRGRVV